MSYVNEDDTLDILRYIATYMKGYKYRDNTNKENLILLEEGLIYYTINKLKQFGIDIDINKQPNISLYELLTILNKKIPKNKSVRKRRTKAIIFNMFNFLIVIII